MTEGSLERYLIFACDVLIHGGPHVLQTFFRGKYRQQHQSNLANIPRLTRNRAMGGIGRVTGSIPFQPVVRHRRSSTAYAVAMEYMRGAIVHALD